MTATNQNGLTIDNNKADFEMDDGTLSYGFIAPKGTLLVDKRGSIFSGGIGSGADTLKDAEPFQHYTKNLFSGGFGQALENSQMGGQAGMGGDQSKYFYGDVDTRRGSVFTPLPARNLIFPGSPTSPLNKELATNETPEIPRGVIPAKVASNILTTYTAQTTTTIFGIKILCYFDTQQTSQITLLAVVTNQTTATQRSGTVNISPNTYHGFKWVSIIFGGTLSVTAGNSIQVVLSPNYSSGVSFGMYADGNYTLYPWCQMENNGSGDTWKQWTGSPRRFERVNNAGTYIVGAITDTTLINTSDTSKTELSLGGTWAGGSLVFDNKLYVGMTTTDRTVIFAASEVANATIPAAGSINTNIVMGPGFAVDGNIYCTDGKAKDKIYKWDGAGGAGVPTTIIAANKIGKPNTNSENPINNFVLYQGLGYAFKPEGIFQVYEDITTIKSTGATDYRAPKLNHIDLGVDEYPYTGTHVTNFQGVLYFNVRNQIYAFQMNDGQPILSVLMPPIPFGRLSTLSYVNGLTSDGKFLYVGLNNIGIFAFDGVGWHKISDFYEYQSNYKKDCGLRFVTNHAPTNTDLTDKIYFGDGRYIVQLPNPNWAAPYSSQMFAKDQNRTFAIIFPEWDGDAAVISKYIRSVVARASLGSNWGMKGVLALYNNSGAANFRTIIEQTFTEGILRDQSFNPTTGGNIIPQTLFATGAPAPLLWPAGTFNTASRTSEQVVSSNDVSNTVNPVSTALILYGWFGNTGTSASPFDSTASYYLNDPVYVDAVAVKYLPIQKLVRYVTGFAIDLTAMSKGTNRAQSVAALNATLAWLDQQQAAQRPCNLTYMSYYGVKKALVGIIQNLQAVTIPSSVARKAVGGNKELAVYAQGIRFDFLSVQSETGGT
jgi:hypothetical protein